MHLVLLFSVWRSRWPLWYPLCCLVPGCCPCMRRMRPPCCLLCRWFDAHTPASWPCAPPPLPPVWIHLPVPAAHAPHPAGFAGAGPPAGAAERSGQAVDRVRPPLAEVSRGGSSARASRTGAGWGLGWCACKPGMEGNIWGLPDSEQALGGVRRCSAAPQPASPPPGCAQPFRLALPGAQHRARPALLAGRHLGERQLPGGAGAAPAAAHAVPFCSTSTAPAALERPAA